MTNGFQEVDRRSYRQEVVISTAFTVLLVLILIVVGLIF
jgi:hypothetical protein